MSTAEDTRMSEEQTYDVPAAAPMSDLSNEFDYTPMSPLAPIGLVLALFGLLAFYIFGGIFIAFAAAIVCLIAVTKIKNAEGAIGGGIPAKIGLTLSALTVVGSSAMYYWNYATECPEGYERHNFAREIAAKQFVYNGRTRLIHPEVEPLMEKPVFIKGWLYQTRSTRNQRDFILLKDSGDCCFGGDPAQFDMIQVTVDPEHPPVDFPMLTHITVAGVISADPTAPDGMPVYTMKAVKCDTAWTSF